MKTNLLSFIFEFSICLFISGYIQAQPAIEFANGSGPATNGSTTTSQVITFKQNALNPITGTYGAFSPATTTTFALSNQQYILPVSQNPNGADVSFGATVTATSKMITSYAQFVAMNDISGAPANDFSATQANVGSGISVASNYATEVFVSAMGLYNASSSTSGRYYMADLTITFSKPITNPVLQLVGLGGTVGAQGYTSELQLLTSGVTLSKLSGSTELNVTSTTILNSSAAPTATTGSGAASGSVLATGSNLTSLVFEIYLRGDGQGPWSTNTIHSGDAFLIGVSALSTEVTLPVTISSFTANARDNKAVLDWTTATEENSSHFIIWHSTDGSPWDSIGLMAAAGNSQVATDYQFIHSNPVPGANYYRLQEVDRTGESAYSPVREVDFAAAQSVAFTCYPNPVRDRLTINTNGTLLTSAMVTTLDGRILQTSADLSSGQSIDFSRYPAGIYFFIMRTTDGKVQVAKIEKN